MKKRLGLILLLCISFTIARAQADTAIADTTAIADSVKDAMLEANSRLLQEAEEARKIDSARKAALEEELSQLKTTDNLKKQELLDELRQIRSADSERVARQQARIDSLKNSVKGFPVTPFLDTILYIYTKLGPFSPGMRAQNIEHRVKDLENDILYNKDSVKLFTSEQTVDLLYRDIIVLSVTDLDALWMGKSKQELAELYRNSIDESIKAHRNATSLQTLLKEIGLALLVIIVAVILIRYLNKGYRWLRVKVRKARGKWIKGVKIRDYELFTADSEVRAIHVVLNIVRWIVILLFIYLVLPVLFSIFPWTKTLSGTLFGYVLTPLKSILSAIWNYLPNLATIIVIAVIFRYVHKGLVFLRNEVADGSLKLPGFYPDWANPTYQILRILMFAFMIIVIFPYLPGSDSAVFKGVSVFLGVLFTFGSSGSLSNIVSGLVLTYMRAYKIGDRVQIGDVTGDIVEKTLLVTRIRTIKNEDITIPNSTVMNSHTVNYSAVAQDMGLILHTTVTFGYDVPWKIVHELLINAATDSAYVLKNPKPFVLQTSLDDYYVSYQLNAYTKEPNKQDIIYSSIHQNIQDKFNEAGVEIMSPHYRAVRDGNQTTIPADHLPEEYITPSFRVQNTDKEDKK